YFGPGRVRLRHVELHCDADDEQDYKSDAAEPTRTPPAFWRHSHQADSFQTARIVALARLLSRSNQLQARHTTCSGLVADQQVLSLAEISGGFTDPLRRRRGSRGSAGEV